MLYLWIFGDNIEDLLGHGRYLVFYLLGGIAAALVHVAVNPASPVPTVGASGAIAAVLGAYAVKFPRARVVTLIPLIIVFQVVALPALLVLGLWFVFQFFSGAMALSASMKSSVAFSAHVGGFLFGAITVKLFEIGRPRQ
jgi:membrane associated rhomboid family serine protease